MGDVKRPEEGAGGGNHSALTLDDGTNPHGTTKTDIGLGDLDSFTANEAVLSDPAIPKFDPRNGHPTLAFDQTTNESAMFHDVMSNDYANGNLTVDIDWRAASATSGDVKWNVAFERTAVKDIDSDGFAAIQTATDAANGTSGIKTRTSITFTQAQADSIVAGDDYRIRITRDASNGGDDMVGDAQVSRVSIRQ